MRRFVPLLLALCFAAPLALADQIPETIIINAAAKKQPPVPFTHAKHATTLAKTCDTCHHLQKNLTAEKVKDMKVVKCSTCHLDPKGEVPSMREMSMTKNPFHIRCISCHKAEKKGPVVCTACHKK
jgi:hypothetical protein